jgi:hypothetical protein
MSKRIEIKPKKKTIRMAPAVFKHHKYGEYSYITNTLFKSKKEALCFVSDSKDDDRFVKWPAGEGYWVEVVL